MTESWRHRIDRADELAAHADAAAPLVVFYAQLLRAQRDLYESLRGERSWRASGSVERDLQVLRPQIGRLLDAVSRYGPEPLTTEARLLLHEGDGGMDAILLDGWRAPSDRRFFPKAVLQPYAHWLATAGIQPVGRSMTRAENRCPFCGGMPQLAILHTDERTAGGWWWPGIALRELPDQVALSSRRLRKLWRGVRAAARLLSLARFRPCAGRRVRELRSIPQDDRPDATRPCGADRR